MVKMQINFKNNNFQIKDKKAKLTIGRLENNKNLINIKVFYQDKVFSIKAPGEYEIGGVSIFGVKGLYVGEMDEIKFCYLPDLDFNLSEKQLQEVDGIDLLLIFLSQPEFKISQIIKTIKKIQPKMLIVAGDKNKKQFLTEFNYDSVRTEKKLALNNLSLSEKMEVVILES